MNLPSGISVEYDGTLNAWDAMDIDEMVSQNINSAALSKAYMAGAIQSIDDQPVAPRQNPVELQSVLQRLKLSDLGALADEFQRRYEVPTDEQLKAKFGELAELNGLEASNVDTFRPNPSGLSMSKMYAIASIRSINGTPVNPLEMDKTGKPTQFKEIAEQIDLGEINGLLRLMGTTADGLKGDALKNLSGGTGDSQQSALSAPQTEP